ncbi:hypothetical protein ACFOWE_12350 [Planomonospora corallina]|uniref:Uncharacterized protein n=1 Tax=Planomonospora corallina TaxID=1806052 RepID=A0ABV8I7Q6_9ACTN
MTHFVYRSHYEGPLGKHVRRLPDATVLDWFRRAWSTVAGGAAPDVGAWLEAELGVGVYGLSSIFEAARGHRLPAPESWRELAGLLREHLYYEGEVRTDEHSVRVRTDDDEVELCYFFFDDALVELCPDRVAYLLHGAWPLPDDTGSGGARPGGGGSGGGPGGESGDGVTHAVLLTFHDGEGICRRPPFSFPGVRLPELAARLRGPVRRREEWPDELLVLRALVAPDEEDLGPALGRCNHWPSFEEQVPPELLGEHAAAHAFALGRLGGDVRPEDRDPARTLLECGAHLAQMAIHQDHFFGYRQWFLFDDVWARRHEDLARSLLRYATDWDPFGPGGR